MTDESEVVTPPEGGDDDAVIAQAKAMGWKPQEEYEGDKPFRSAKEFVDRAYAIAPAQRRRIDQLERRLEEQEKVFSQQMEAQRAVYQSQIETLRAQRKEAITLGDVEEVEKLDAEIDGLKVRAAPAAPAPVAPPRELADWVEKNAHWVDVDPEMTQAAATIGAAIQKANPGITPVEMVRLLDSRMRRIYPDEMEGPRKAQGEADPGGRRSAPQGGKDDTRTTVDGVERSFRDLPKPAQEACDQLIAEGLVKSRKQYVEFYKW